ncbi:hypothetical protein H696_01298 [Fonticula alba]|uniref:SAC domain-containing protein n=1 Tax=Fonticula alba TaxID=691883 RepID=A0A058ZBW6_FONAL|nr:hypothetical protein H696_01298 [Fonticula alba]KCV71889.1 hypothetical protein H696_01298 [Fonticula alba]|eukprot:XP_009493467.1 hypothetical protein H696_01298 [Fonticula alba]
MSAATVPEAGVAAVPPSPAGGVFGLGAPSSATEASLFPPLPEAPAPGFVIQVQPHSFLVQRVPEASSATARSSLVTPTLFIPRLSKTARNGQATGPDPPSIFPMPYLDVAHSSEAAADPTFLVYGLLGTYQLLRTRYLGVVTSANVVAVLPSATGGVSLVLTARSVSLLSFDPDLPAFHSAAAGRDAAAMFDSSDSFSVTQMGDARNRAPRSFPLNLEASFSHFLEQSGFVAPGANVEGTGAELPPAGPGGSQPLSRSNTTGSRIASFITTSADLSSRTIAATAKTVGSAGASSASFLTGVFGRSSSNTPSASRPASSAPRAAPPPAVPLATLDAHLPDLLRPAVPPTVTLASNPAADIDRLPALEAPDIRFLTLASLSDHDARAMERIARLLTSGSAIFTLHPVAVRDLADLDRAVQAEYDDLTRSMQSRLTRPSRGRVAGDDAFCMNAASLMLLVDPCSGDSERRRISMSPFCIRLVHGFAQSSTVTLSGVVLVVSLHARKHSGRPGLRYQRRGSDLAGNVANFVESEMRIARLASTGAPTTASGANVVDSPPSEWLIASHVQIRGSIPLLWTQPPQHKLELRPAINVSSSWDSCSAVCRKHFEWLKTRHNNIVCVNLVDKEGREKQLGEHFGRHLSQIATPGVSYEAFDFHAECRGGRFGNIDRLIDRIEKRALADHGFFCLRVRVPARATTVADIEAAILSHQQGVVRTNCIDCLDRTNVLQASVASRLFTRAFVHGHILPTLSSVSRDALLSADNAAIIERQIHQMALATGGAQDFADTRYANGSPASEPGDDTVTPSESEADTDSEDELSTPVLRQRRLRQQHRQQLLDSEPGSPGGDELTSLVAVDSRSVNAPVPTAGRPASALRSLPLGSHFDALLAAIWADHGDALSRAYAGTAALKGDFTRTGRRTTSGRMTDGVNSMTRMYRNAFIDSDLQNLYDYIYGRQSCEVFLPQAAPSPSLSSLGLRERTASSSSTAPIAASETSAEHTALLSATGNKVNAKMAFSPETQQIEDPFVNVYKPWLEEGEVALFSFLVYQLATRFDDPANFATAEPTLTSRILVATDCALLLFGTPPGHLPGGRPPPPERIDLRTIIACLPSRPLLARHAPGSGPHNADDSLADSPSISHSLQCLLMDQNGSGGDSQAECSSASTPGTDRVDVNILLITGDDHPGGIEQAALLLALEAEVEHHRAMLNAPRQDGGAGQADSEPAPVAPSSCLDMPGIRRLSLSRLSFSEAERLLKHIQI